MESIYRPVTHMIHYRENISLLTQQVERLAGIRGRVKQTVEMAIRRGEEIESDVVRWLIGADEIICVIEKLLKEEQSRKKPWINVWGRYSWICKAKKIESEVVELIERGEFEGVSSSGNPLPVLHQHYFLTDSNAAVINGIKAGFKDENVKRIGVFGVEGVGKTRLVQNVCLQVEEEGLFDKVAEGIVGYKLEYERIREQIAEKLKLELDLEGRGALLYRRLNVDDDVLIILDDVWFPIDLYELGIPPLHRCKIVLISRDRFVLNSMDCEEIWEVKDVGSSDDVWKMFESAVGDDIADSPVLKPLAQEVAYQCGTLPIAIHTVARALRGKPDYIWRHSLEHLKVTNDPPLGLGILEKTYLSLLLGFNLLESEEAKSIFLLCSLFPQYSNIPIDHLIYYRLGFPLLQEAGTLLEVRNRVYTSVEYLKVSALLMDGAGHEHVRMHSVARHAALHFSPATSFSIFSQADSDLVPLPKSYIHTASAISLSLKSIDHFPLGLQCPNPTLLALDCSSRCFSSSSSRMETGFFCRMKDLKVLHLIEMREFSLPPSVCALENLKTLLLECCTLKQNDHLCIIGTLTNLEVLSFYGSDIQALPAEIGHLTGLRMLNLSNCNKLTKIPPRVISRLSSLEGLYMSNSFVKWEMDKDGKERKNLSIGELTSLPLLSELDIHIPDATYLPNDYSLIFEPLHRFDISIGSTIAKIQGLYPSSRTFKFSGKHVNDTVIVLLKKAETIYLNELSSYFGEDVRDRDDFLNCRYLEVCNCVGVESIINLKTSLIPKNTLHDHGRFCNMESLQVIDCDRLEFLFLSSTARCLVRLRELKIKRCDQIKHIIRCESSEETAANAMVFPKLRSLVLDFLPSLVCFSSEPSVSGVSSETPPLFNDMVEFPCLEMLSIYGLDQVEVICDNQIPVECFPKLRSIIVINHTKIPRIENMNQLGDIFRNLKQLTFMTTPRASAYLEQYGLHGLRALTMWGHPKMMRRSIIMDSFVPKFRTNNLRELQLWNCNTLRYAISSSTAKLFPRLQTLIIVSCNFMVQVLADDNLNDAVLFPPLKCLILQHLPNLTGFIVKNLIMFKMASSICLETLSIVNCPLIKTFAVETQGLGGSGSGSGSTDDHTQIHIPSVHFFRDQVVDFRHIVTLKLSVIDSVQKIWDSTQIPIESFCLLRELVVQKCSNLLQVFSFDSLRCEKLPCLEELIVEDCHLLREVFDLQNESCLALGKIKKLRLIKLPSLQHFCKQCLDTPENEIGESDTDNMSRFFGSLFSYNVARRLEKLEILEVVECKVEEVVARQKDSNVDIDFSRVHTIKLKDLPNLVRFCSDNQRLRWSSLTTVEVERCPNLETLASVFFTPSPEKADGDTTQQMTISSTSTQHLIKQELALATLSLHHLAKLKEIWKDHQHHILVFSHLSFLTIHGCERLRTLFTPTLVEGLSQLRDLIVDSCKMIEEIISDERSGTAASIRKIVLPQLKTIELKNLPGLVSFLSREYMLEFPLLLNVRVEECPQLQTFSPGKIDAPNLTKVQTGDSQWEWKGDLESTIGDLFKGEVQFSEDTELRVSDPDKLMEILEIKLHYKAFRRLKLLHVECCDKELRDFLSKLSVRFQELTEVYVGNCNSLEQLFNTEELILKGGVKIFTKLEELKLWNLPRLFCIWKEEMGRYVSLKNLKRINICQCGHLLNLFSPSIARDFQQLQELKIQDCDTMEEVVAAKIQGGKGNDAFQEICLPQLQHLELIGLSNLKTFHSGNYAFEWPYLHTLRIEKCPRLKSLTPGFIRTPKSSDVDGMPQETVSNKMVGFPRLNQLCLKSLEHFEEIWQERVTEESLTDLQILKIDDCGKLLNVIPHDVLPRLEKLEKLIIKNCRSLRKVFDLDAQIIDIKHVGSNVSTRLNEPISTSLADLVPDGLIAVFENVQVLKLRDCYRLNNLFLTSIARSFTEFKGQLIEEQNGKGKEMVKLDFKLLPQLNFLDLDLSSLTLDKCPEIKNFSLDLPALRQPLFDQVSRFERLEELHLVHLGSFEQIWHDKLPIRSLNKLRILYVEKGEKLLKIVPSHTLVNLLELEKLYVQQCDSLKHIFDLDGIMESINGELFPKLTVLVLTHLPEMVGIFSKEPTGIPIFRNLRSLRIIHCNSLKSLISASAAKGLQQLKEFKIFGCIKMQVVIEDDEKDAKEHMVFPELRYLVLKHLPQLKSFYQGKNTIKWPVLDVVRVKSVPTMDIFAPGAQETPQLTTIYVTFLEKCWKGDLNQTIKFLHENKKMGAATKTVVPEFEAISSYGQIQEEDISSSLACFGSSG